MGLGTFRRNRFGAAGTIGCQNFYFWIHFSVATLFRFVAHFACGRVEDSSFNRFALNGTQEIACFIVFSSKLGKYKKIRKRRRNIRRQNGTAPSCPAPNRRRWNGPPPDKCVPTWNKNKKKRTQDPKLIFLGRAFVPQKFGNVCNNCVHTEKYFLGLVESNWKQIVYTIFRLSWNQTDFRFESIRKW